MQNVLKVEGSDSRVLHRDHLYMCILMLVFFPYACCYWFTLIVFDVFVSVHSCIVYTLTLVAFAFIVFALFISYTLMIFVVVAFVCRS